MPKMIVDKTPVSVLKIGGEDFISLTDMASGKDGQSKFELHKQTLPQLLVRLFNEFQKTYGSGICGHCKRKTVPSPFYQVVGAYYLHCLHLEAYCRTTGMMLQELLISIQETV